MKRLGCEKRLKTIFHTIFLQRFAIIYPERAPDRIGRRFTLPETYPGFSRTRHAAQNPLLQVSVFHPDKSVAVPGAVPHPNAHHQRLSLAPQPFQKSSPATSHIIPLITRRSFAENAPEEEEELDIEDDVDNLAKNDRIRGSDFSSSTFYSAETHPTPSDEECFQNAESELPQSENKNDDAKDDTQGHRMFGSTLNVIRSLSGSMFGAGTSESVKKDDSIGNFSDYEEDHSGEGKEA